MIKKSKIIVGLIALLALTACVNFPLTVDSSSYPKPREQIELERIGKLTGDDGIIVSMGSNKRQSKSGKNMMPVNSYLWRAGLDTIYFMPIEKIDPFAGVIMTGWYSTPGNTHERFKLNIFILSGELRSDSLKVSAFRQLQQGKRWGQEEESRTIANAFEEKILMRARSIKVGEQE
ncbi:MAG: DUF3576 domain-containing protein [Proteobacteria bacterium]|nr:DUF3576 domain-containing protein [Pseudomonadota bacterium]